MVDTQPEQGNHSLPARHFPDVVIDHHPERPDSHLAPIADVGGADRRHLARWSPSTSGRAGSRCRPQVATALFYGIKADTRDLGRQTTPAGRRRVPVAVPDDGQGRARRDRAPEAARRVLPPLPHRDRAGAGVRRRGGLRPRPRSTRRTWSPRSRSASCSSRTCSWSLASREYEDALYFSLRTSDRRMNAGRLIREVIEAKGGSAGGHGTMAGARLPLKGLSARPRAAAARGGRARFLDAFGVRARRTRSSSERSPRWTRVIYLDHNAITPVRPEARAAVLAALERVREPLLRPRAPGAPRATCSTAPAPGSRPRSARGPPRSSSPPARPSRPRSPSAACSAPRRRARTARRHRGRAPVRPRRSRGRSRRRGTPLTVVPVDRRGRARPRRRSARRSAPTSRSPARCARTTRRASLLPVRQLAAAARERGAPFFCDAVQAVGKIEVDVRTLGADLVAAHRPEARRPARRRRALGHARAAARAALRRRAGARPPRRDREPPRRRRARRRASRPPSAAPRGGGAARRRAPRPARGGPPRRRAAARA